MQKNKTNFILIFCILYIFNNVYTQDPFIYYQCGKIQNNPDLIINAGLQKLNPNTNEVINLGATPIGGDIAFHPDGRLFMVKVNDIFEIDTISSSYPVYPKELIASLPANCIMVGMTIDKEGIIWMSGKVDNKNSICTFNMANATFKIMSMEAEVSSNNVGVDIEWYNGELYTIGIDMPVTQNTTLNKINLTDFSISSSRIYGRRGLSYALASVNDECGSLGLYAPTGFPNTNNVYTDGYFDFDIDLNSLEAIENTDMGIGPQGATSRTSWLGSYTPLAIDTVDVDEDRDNCKSPYTLTVHTQKGYYMRPGIEFSLDGIIFQSDSTFPNLSPGKYVVHLKDSLGCYKLSDTIHLEERLSADLHTIKTICGLDNGSLLVKKPDPAMSCIVSIDGSPFVMQDSFPGLSTGSHQVVVEYEGGCRDTSIVMIDAQPLPDFNVTQNILDSYCDQNNGSVLLITADPANVIFYSTDGINYIRDSIRLRDLDAGNYKVYLKHESGCNDTINVAIQSFPPSYFTSIDIVPASCGMADGKITVSTSQAGGELFLDGTFTANGTFDHLAQGVYTLETINTYGCVSDTTIIIPGQHLPIIEDVIKSDAHCNEANGSITIRSTEPTDRYSMNGINYQALNHFSQLATGIYDVYIQNEEGCWVIRRVEIFQTGLPVIDSLDITNESCDQGNGTIRIYTSGSQVKLYTLNESLTSTDPVFDQLTGGAYMMIVQDAYGCEQRTAFRLDNEGAIRGISSIQIEQGDCVQLLSKVYMPAHIEEKYTIEGIPDSPDGIYLLQPGQYTVQIENGYCSRDTVIAILPGSCEPFVPNVFSPNGDGVNDYFRVEGSGFEVVKIWVFNRWGGVMYTEVNGNRGWDGTYKGHAVEPDVYTYYVEVNYQGQRKLIEGSVVVVR